MCNYHHNFMILCKIWFWPPTVATFIHGHCQLPSKRGPGPGPERWRLEEVIKDVVKHQLSAGLLLKNVSWTKNSISFSRTPNCLQGLQCVSLAIKGSENSTGLSLVVGLLTPGMSRVSCEIWGLEGAMAYSFFVLGFWSYSQRARVEQRGFTHSHNPTQA